LTRTTFNLIHVSILTIFPFKWWQFSSASYIFDDNWPIADLLKTYFYFYNLLIFLGLNNKNKDWTMNDEGWNFRSCQLHGFAFHSEDFKVSVNEEVCKNDDDNEGISVNARKVRVLRIFWCSHDHLSLLWIFTRQNLRRKKKAR